MIRLANAERHSGRAKEHLGGKIKFKDRGPGLGLLIAGGILEANVRTICVESKNHDKKGYPGSIFHVLLPIRPQPPDPELARLLGIETNQKEES